MPHNHCQLPFAANGLTNGAEKVWVAGEGCTAQRANLARPQRQPEAVAAATGGRQELSRRVAKARLIFTDVCEEPPGGGGLGCAMRHSSPAEGFFFVVFGLDLGGGGKGVCNFHQKRGGLGLGTPSPPSFGSGATATPSHIQRPPPVGEHLFGGLTSPKTLFWTKEIPLSNDTPP